jgi:hypothetical protein
MPNPFSLGYPQTDWNQPIRKDFSSNLGLASSPMLPGMGVGTMDMMAPAPGGSPLDMAIPGPVPMGDFSIQDPRGEAPMDMGMRGNILSKLAGVGGDMDPWVRDRMLREYGDNMGNAFKAAAASDGTDMYTQFLGHEMKNAGAYDRAVNAEMLHQAALTKMEQSKFNLEDDKRKSAQDIQDEQAEIALGKKMMKNLEPFIEAGDAVFMGQLETAMGMLGSDATRAQGLVMLDKLTQSATGMSETQQKAMRDSLLEAGENEVIKQTYLRTGMKPGDPGFKEAMAETFEMNRQTKELEIQDTASAIAARNEAAMLRGRTRNIGGGDGVRHSLSGYSSGLLGDRVVPVDYDQVINSAGETMRSRILDEVKSDIAKVESKFVTYQNQIRSEFDSAEFTNRDKTDKWLNEEVSIFGVKTGLTKGEVMGLDFMSDPELIKRIAKSMNRVDLEAMNSGVSAGTIAKLEKERQRDFDEKHAADRILSVSDIIERIDKAKGTGESGVTRVLRDGKQGSVANWVENTIMYNSDDSPNQIGFGDYKDMDPVAAATRLTGAVLKLGGGSFGIGLKILREASDEDEREAMLSNPGSEEWTAARAELAPGVIDWRVVEQKKAQDVLTGPHSRWTIP